jgi:hypothetical protein
MTETTYLGAAALGYLTDVGGALSDLASVDRDELIEQVHEHLNAIVAEAGHEVSRDELMSRLGVPSAYADQLRSAAGLEPRAGEMATKSSLSPRGVELALRGGAIGAATWAYLRRLAPAWWAARGYLIAGLVLPWWLGLGGVTTGGKDFAGTFFLHWWIYDPAFTDESYTNGWRLFWIIPIAAFVVAAAAVGLRAERGTLRTYGLNRALDVLGVVALVLVPTWWAGPLMYAFVLRQ